MSNDFVHLHVHSHYSLLDGLTKPEPLLKKCAEYGMDACALTDHGNLFGLLEFYTKAEKYGVKPILGCEVYVSPIIFADYGYNREMCCRLYPVIVKFYRPKSPFLTFNINFYEKNS